MKQICFARNTEDISALLGHAEALMSAMRADPDKDDIYNNPDTSTLSAAAVLLQPTEVECHTRQADQTIMLMPDPQQSMDRVVSLALHTSEPSPSSPSPSVKIAKGIKG